MISLALARTLRDAGLRWDPAPGDRFVIADRDMDGEVFTLSEMTVELHEFPSGKVIGFNGTVEWALDSVEAHNSVWLPSEAQLRERLGGAFRRLSLVDGRLAGRDRRARRAPSSSTPTTRPRPTAPPCSTWSPSR